MVTVNCYSVDIDSAHVVIDIDTYLATKTPTAREITAPLMWGADTLVLTLSGADTTYNYMVVNTGNVSHYYHAAPNVVTPNGITYTLTIDRWARAVKRGLRINCGRLVSGHVLPEFSSFGFDLPVQPIPYGIWNASTFFYEDNRYVVLASITLAPAHKDGPQRPVLVASDTFTMPDDQALLRAAVGNLSRATHLSLNSGSGDNEIMSIAQMWLVPAWVAVSTTFGGSTVIANPNATLRIDNNADKTVPAYWFSDGATHIFRHKQYQSFAEVFGTNDKRLTVNYFGNFASNAEMPFIGQRTTIPVVISVLNWTAGTFSMVAEMGDQRIPLDTSLELSFTATRKDQRDVDLFINDAITTVTSALAIAGGVATGSAVAAAGGVVSLGAGIAKAATRQNRHSTGTRGNAIASILTWSNEERYVGACGLMRYSLTNEDEVMSALRRQGYVGGADVADINIADLGATSKYVDGHYDGTYLQFSNVTLYHAGQDPDDVRAVQDMLTNGVMLYRDVALVGKPLDPVYIFNEVTNG